MKPWLALILLSPLFGCAADNPILPNASTPQGQCAIQVDHDPQIQQLEEDRLLPANHIYVTQILAQENALRQQLFDACMQNRAPSPTASPR
jgi:hypothetical protein